MNFVGVASSKWRVEWPVNNWGAQMSMKNYFIMPTYTSTIDPLNDHRPYYHRPPRLRGLWLVHSNSPLLVSVVASFTAFVSCSAAMHDTVGTENPHSRFWLYIHDFIIIFMIVLCYILWLLFIIPHLWFRSKAWSLRSAWRQRSSPTV